MATVLNMEKPPVVNELDFPQLPEDFSYRRYVVVGSGLGLTEDVVFGNLLTAFARQGNWKPLPISSLIVVVCEIQLHEETLLPNLVALLHKLANRGIIDLVQTVDQDLIVPKPALVRFIKRANVIRTEEIGYYPRTATKEKKNGLWARFQEWLEG